MDLTSLPLPRGFVVTATAVTADAIVIAANSNRSCDACPRCSQVSHRIHSRYVRAIADQSWHGRQVILRIRAHRFHCQTVGCARKIFCERLINLASSQARCTDRLKEVQQAVGLALGGEAGSRLCHRLASPTSGDTLLRRVKTLPEKSIPSPRVLGVDDFAFRKGQTYGTILFDLERRRVIDLLPDRSAETFADWLRHHPGIEIITRDRASSYSQAAALAAPKAVQIADRFHLLVNVRNTLERQFQTGTATLRRIFAGTSAAESPASPSVDSRVPPESLPETRGRRHLVFEQVRTLHRDGVPLRQIARDLKLHYRTVERYVRSDACPDWNRGHSRPRSLDHFRDFIGQRLRDGCHSAAQIGRELATQGFRGAASVVRHYVRQLRAELGLAAARPSRPLTATPRLPPSARRLSLAVIRRPSDRTEEERTMIEQIRMTDSECRRSIELAEGFAKLVRNRREAGLTEWLAEAAETSGWTGFAQGLRRDEAAVRAALSMPWSNGPVEGAVNRLKFLKRQMFGRAGFDLLKSRVLNAA